MQVNQEYCIQCRQLLTNCHRINEGNVDHLKELMMLTDEEMRSKYFDIDETPSCKMENFHIYADCGHIVDFTGDILETGGILYIEGNLKHLLEINSKINEQNCESVKMGPILRWWTYHDGGNDMLVGVSTQYTNIFLLFPSNDYIAIWEKIKFRVLLYKVTLDFLIQKEWKEPTYKQMIITVCSQLNIEESTVLENSEFLIKQIENYDKGSLKKEQLLLSLPCIKRLATLADLQVKIPKLKKRFPQKGNQQNRNIKTKLIENIFGDIFPSQIFLEENENSQCSTNILNQESDFQKINNISSSDSETENSESSSEEYNVKPSRFRSKDIPTKLMRTIPEIRFFEKPIKSEKEFSFYLTARVGNLNIFVGDFVTISSNNSRENEPIVRIQYIFKDSEGYFHGQLFCTSEDTILGIKGNEKELFFTGTCSNYPLNSILQIIQVTSKPSSIIEKDAFYCRKKYNFHNNSFEDFYIKQINDTQITCDFCESNRKYKSENNLNINDCVYINTDVVKDRISVFQELGYSSFICAKIENIIKNEFGEIYSLKIFYRPEYISKDLMYSSNIFELYFTNLEVAVEDEEIIGSCFVKFFEDSQSGSEWCKLGPNRFYFNKFYNAKTNCFDVLDKSTFIFNSNGILEWPKLKSPLKAMDVFGGFGGLSKGLQISTLCDTRWMIEINPNAAYAFEQNFRECHVFNQDANDFLYTAMSEMTYQDKTIPKPGEVDIIASGPPCQGYSKVNRFSGNLNAKRQNSLVTTLLSFVDFYRPKYFVFENVRSFSSHMKGTILKLTLRSLLDMDYQIRYGVLQAGQFGVAQNRKRFFIIAAASGLTLPNFPTPQFSFPNNCCNLSFFVDGRRYENYYLYKGSAPYRMLTVRDTIYDLRNKMNDEFLEENLEDHVSKKLKPLSQVRVKLIPKEPGADWRSLAQTYKEQIENHDRHVTYKNPSLSSPHTRILVPAFIHRKRHLHNNFKGMYGRLHWDGYFETTFTNPDPMHKQGRVIHPEEDRILSVRECARSQGFSDSYITFGSIYDKYKQIGNAVPPPLACEIGRSIIEAIHKDQDLEFKLKKDSPIF